MSRANKQQTQQVLDIAEKDPSGWRKTTIEERHRLMYEAANRLGEMRGDLNGSMCAITGKTVEEADVEVSEAIDYCMQFMTVTDKPGSTTDYKKSYAEWYEREFCHARNIQPHSNEYHRYGSQIEVPEVE